MPLKTRLTISSWNVQGLFKRNDNERVSKLNEDDFLSHIKSDMYAFLKLKQIMEIMYPLKVIVYLNILLGLGKERVFMVE